MVTARGRFQPYHQPCQPDLLQAASVSMLGGGTRPCARSCLCHTPSRARRAVLSTAAPWPCATQGLKTGTSNRPKQPINSGSVVDQRCNRRSQVRRRGKRPGVSVNNVRRGCTSGSVGSRKRNNAHAGYQRRMLRITSAFKISRSGEVTGRPRGRFGGGGGIGIRSIILTKLTSRLSHSTLIGPPEALSVRHLPLRGAAA